MNIIDLQERLKDLPEEALMQEMQMPTGSAPQFLVLSELKRRKRMRDDYQRMQASDMKTVAEETITAAGMPQSGIMGVAQAMAPKSAIAQDTGLNDMQQMDPTQAPQPEQPMMMADGGYVDDARMARLDMLREEVLARDALGLPEDAEYMSENNETDFDEYLRDVGEVIDMFNPISSALSAARYALDDDYAGAGINAASTLPLGKALSLMRGLSQLAPEAYDSYAGDDDAVGMADGGYVRYMQGGGYPSTEVQQTRSILASDPGTQILAARMGMTVEEYIESLSPEARALNIQRIAEGRRREGEVRADVFDPAVPVLDQVSSDLSDFEPKDPSYLLGEKILSDYGGVNPSDKISSGVYGASKPDVFPEDRSVFEMDEEYNRAKEQERLNAAVLDEMSKDRGLTEREPSFMQDVVPFLGDFVGATYDAVAPKRENIAETLSGGVEAYTDALLNMAGESEGKELPMDTGTPLEIPEDGVGSLLPPARQEVAPDIATSDSGTGTGAGAGTGTGGGAGGGGGAFGSIEDRIAKMLEERDRSAQADKWLALAQTGLALMSSTQPTIGGAIGEAGLAGIGAMRDARSQYDEDILKLLGAQSDIEQYKDARRLAAAKASRGSGASLDKAIDNARQYINMLYGEAASYRQIVTDPVTGEAKLVEMVPPGLQARIVAAEDRLDALNRLGSSGEQVMFDATQTQ